MNFKKYPTKTIFTYYKVQGFDLEKFFTLSGLSTLLKNGAFIGGGFARQIFMKKDLAKYFNIAPDNDQRHCRPGDIDVFFPSAQKYRQAVNYFNSKLADTELAMLGAKEADLYTHAEACKAPLSVISVGLSYAKLCTNVTLLAKHNQSFYQTKHDQKALRYWTDNSIKLQLVGEFFGDYHSISSSFDFTNVKVFITNDWIYFHKDIMALESRSLLEVSNDQSPLLATRINKYLNTRGLSKVTEGSSDAFNTWLCRVRSGQWGDHPLHVDFKGAGFDKFSSDIAGLIRRPQLVSVDSLSLLVGKLVVRKLIHRGYMGGTVYKNVDLAIQEYNNRKENK